MWSTAIKELKFHPGRYIATLLAIAISVAFLAASSIITGTESRALAMQDAAPMSQADLVIRSLNHERSFDDQGGYIDPTEDVPASSAITATIQAVPGVALAEPMWMTQVYVTTGETTTPINIISLPSDQLRSTDLKSGQWPEPGEILLNQRSLEALNTAIGQSISIDNSDLTVSGVSTDPGSRLFANTAYVSPDYFTKGGDPIATISSWLIKITPGADLNSVKSAIDQALTDQLAGTQLKADLIDHQQLLADAAKSYTGDIDTMKYLLWIFAGIAMVVGLITIANTFTILLTGRQRQIGLIRAIGATGKQVRHAIWAEAAIVGVVGGLLGIGLACGLTALLGLYTGSVAYGLAVPLTETIMAVVIGVIITLVACVQPARRATRVSPIEALQPVSAAVVTRQYSLTRLIVCALLAAAGAVVIYMGMSSDDPLMLSVIGALLVAVAVLFGSRLFTPAILKALGWVIKRWGPSADVAAKNVVRDPRRASATATALMLAVGLIITLQVGSASISQTLIHKIDSDYPLPLTVDVSRNGPEEPVAVPETVKTELDDLRGIDRVVSLSCKWVELGGSAAADQFFRVCRYDPSVVSIATAFPQTMPDSEIWVGQWDSIYEIGTDGGQTGYELPGRDISLPSAAGPDLPLKAVAQNVAASGYSTGAEGSSAVYNNGWWFASPNIYQQLAGQNLDGAVVLAGITKDVDVLSLYNATAALTENSAVPLNISGSMGQQYMVEQAMDIVVGTVTVLLGVAVIIALVGVSNTLTLSVIERRRESAILRAVGAQKRQLRAMLLI
ncbi:MAG: ABC transporter permease, partial [Propionibacteriaceae bacterium]|nr:ABC transporter permease [Propionibacteriaceae bacterium]